MENKMKKPTENVHKGHRQRLRKKYLEHGIESLEQHEILELLLFYVFAQKNTNVIAHNLLQRFGSLSSVLDASQKSLMDVPDIGEQAAVLLKLQSDMCRVYAQDKFHAIKNRQMTPSNAGEYIKTLFYGYTDEIFYLVSLDSECRLINADIVARGTINNVAIYSRELVKKALDTGAAFAIIAHNHPNGVLKPSEQDMITTKVIQNAFHFINVRLIDHVIVSGDQYISLQNDYGALD